MAIVEDRQYKSMVYPDDPDDYRPNSSLAVVLDPTQPDGSFVNGISVLFERIAPGDRIPLHTHTVEEVIIIDEGTAEVTLGSERRVVGAGAVVFIPINTPHGTRNVGEGVLRLHAMFPTQTITIQYLERNPAPGTEDDAPQPLATIDIREWG